MAESNLQRDMLDPDAVRSASALGLLARQIVEGYKVGEHRSPLKGFAIEFAQHREYAPGDDVRHLDWKVLGRSDRLFIKQYEQDTNFMAHALIDASGSMGYGSGALTKFHYAKVLAACLSYAILQQRDAVSVGFIGGGEAILHPRTDAPGRLPWVMESLAAAEAEGASDLGGDLLRLAPQVRPRSIVIVASDLLSGEEGFFRALARFQDQRTEVILFHLLDRAELTLPFTGKVRFEGLEGEPVLVTHPEEFAVAYREEVRAFCQSIRAQCESRDAHYVLVDTARPVGETLGEYLAFRRRLHR